MIKEITILEYNDLLFEMGKFHSCTNFKKFNDIKYLNQDWEYGKYAIISKSTINLSGPDYNSPILKGLKFKYYVVENYPFLKLNITPLLDDYYSCVFTLLTYNKGHNWYDNKTVTTNKYLLLDQEDGIFDLMNAIDNILEKYKIRKLNIDLFTSQFK